MDNIRNFAIIAHIDHGKSTLADRLLELTNTVPKTHNEQLLDRNPISRERGITIKLAPVRMMYKISKSEFLISNQYPNSNDQNSKQSHSSEGGNRQLEQIPNQVGNDNSIGSEYILNLIDTPGHVDFSYEVDRTLACVEGVILLVDATQGIQAQTISNAYKAIEKNLVIIPVINKIDLPSANIEKTEKEISEFLGINKNEILKISAKTGEGVTELVNIIIQKISAPSISKSEFLISNQNPNTNDQNLKNTQCRALIFDSYFDSHKGVIAFVRIFSGNIEKGKKLKLGSNSQTFEVKDVGIFTPDLISKENLSDGEIGYVVTSLKDIHMVKVGDSLLDMNSNNILPGYKKVKPMVYASIFPTDTNDYLNLKKALEKLYLNDSSLEFSTTHSKALGTGFRVGFLGLLHADVVRERLEREYDLHLVLTPPQVDYIIKDHKYSEPIAKILIITPHEYMNSIMELCKNHRTRFITMDNKNQTTLIYEIPMSELISDFYDNLKSVSSGYASLDWEFIKYKEVEADKLELLLNLEPVEEFSQIVVSEKAQKQAYIIVKRLKNLIPRQQYEIKIQAKYKGKIIASSRVAPFRKDVTQKLYGGDRTRKDKLLKKQKAGKKKMKMVGRVEIPKEAFLKLFRK